MDNFFFIKAKENLVNNPYKYIKHYLNKLFAFSIKLSFEKELFIKRNIDKKIYNKNFILIHNS